MFALSCVYIDTFPTIHMLNDRVELELLYIQF